MKHKKLIILGSFFAVTAVAIGVALHVLMQPAIGTKATVSKAATQKKAPEVAPTVAAPLDNEYFSLTLPPGFVVQSSAGASSGGQLATFMLTKSSLSGTLIGAIGITAIPEGGPKSNPNYALRLSQSDRFKFSTIEAGGKSFPMAIDTQAGGAVVFYDNGTYLASISMTSGLGNPGEAENSDIVKRLTQLMGGWQWKS